LKCGLIQATNACDPGEKLEIIREANVNKHLELIGGGRAPGRADPLHAGDLHRPVLLRRTEHALV